MPFINLPITSRIYKNGIRISQVYNRDLSLWGQRDPHWDNLVFNFLDVSGSDKSPNNVTAAAGAESYQGYILISALHPTGMYDLFDGPGTIPDDIQYTIDFTVEYLTGNTLDKSPMESTVVFYFIEYSNSGNIRDTNKFKFLWNFTDQKFQFYENGNMRETSQFQLLKNTKYTFSINRNTFDINDNQIKIFINGVHYPTNNDLLPRCPLVGTDAANFPNTRFVIPPNNMIYYKKRFTKGSHRRWASYDHEEEMF